MREILFKAKSKQTGEWVEGYLYCDKSNNDEYKIIRYEKWFGEQSELVMRIVPIDPETLCQYTGLKDKNGVKIFDGDTVVLDKGQEHEKNGFVSYSNGVFVIQFERTWDFLCTNLEYAEIIGNIHDKEKNHDD